MAEIKKYDPQKTPFEQQPTILITGQMQTRLYKTLSNYTPSDQHDALVKLLENGYSDCRVWVKLRADSLAYIFKQAREAANNPILADMKPLAIWLAAYFYYGEENSKPVTHIYSYKVLRNNTKLKKDNQIRLKQ